MNVLLFNIKYDVEKDTFNVCKSSIFGDIVKIDGEEVTIKVKNKDNYVEVKKGDGIAFKYNKKIKGIYLEDIVRQDRNELVINTTRLLKVGTEVFISY